MNGISTIRHYLTNLGVLLFPLILPMPLPLKTKSIALILFLITLLGFIDISKLKWRNILANKTILLFALLFLIEPITSFLREEQFSYSEVKLSFIIAPLLFYLSQSKIKRHKNSIFYVFIIGVFVYLAFALIYLIYFYSTSKYEVFGLDYYLKYVLYHHLPFAIHHTYLGVYICFANTLILFSKRPTNQIKILLSIPLFFSIFIIGSKFSIVIYCFLLLIYMFWVLRSRIKVLIFTIVIFSITILSSVYVLMVRTDLFRTLEDSIFIRYRVFQCSLKGISDNVLLGVGRKGIKEFIENCVDNAQIRMDTHNVLLQEFLANGVFGIFLLILLIVHLFKSAKIIEFKVFLVIFFSAGMLEHILTLQHGVTFFVFFSLLFNFTSNDVK